MKLYKHYPPNSIDFILIDKGISLRLSQVQVLNDPFELKGIWTEYHDDEIDLAIDEMKKDKNSQVSKYPDCEKDLREAMKKIDPKAVKIISNIKNNSAEDRLAVTSFTEKINSRAMWAYYSDNHSGFILEFEKKEIDKIIKKSNHLFQIKKANYSEKIPKNPDRTLETLIDFVNTKDNGWFHESEYRLIANTSKLSDNGLDQNGYPIYIELFPIESISSIVLGIRSDKTLERKAQYWIDKYAPHVQLLKANVSDTDYDFNFDPIRKRLTTDTPST